MKALKNFLNGSALRLTLSATAAIGAFLLGIFSVFIPMWKSTLFPKSSVSVLISIMSFTVLYIFYIWTLKRSYDEMERDNFCMVLCLVIFTLLIQTANIVMIPMVEYTSGNPVSDSYLFTSDGTSVLSASFKVFKQSLAFIFSSMILFFSMRGIKIKNMHLRAILPLNRKKITVLNIICSVTALIFGGLFFILEFINGSSNTTAIFGIQVGLILIAFIFGFVWLIDEFNRIPAFMYARKKPEPYKKIMALDIVGFAVLILSYLMCKEIGIPTFCIISIFTWYSFYKRDIATSPFTVAVPITLFIAMPLIIAYRHYISLAEGETKEKWRRSLSGLFAKFEERGFFGKSGSGENPLRTQADVAVERVSSAGAFGSDNFQFLNEGTTDYSISLCTHYMGYVWLCAVLLSLFMLVVCGNIFFRRAKKENIYIPAAVYMSFICIVMISTWSILSSMGLLGIIGISCYASGAGYSNWILSGLLFGFMIYSTKKTQAFESTASENKR